MPIVNKRNPHPLKNCLDNFKKSWGDLDNLSKINESWKDLIGLELFQECKPLNIEKSIRNFPKKNELIKIAKEVGFKIAEYRDIFWGQMGIIIVTK